MKLIYPDNISSVTASEENANYLATNVQDEHPKKVWKGTSRDATLTCVVTGGGALAVIATNAESISLTLSTGQTWTLDTGWSIQDGWALDTSGDSTVTQIANLTGGIDGAAWFDFSENRTGSFTATLDLTAAAGEIIQAGIVRCGTLRTFVDPRYGIQEGLEDYSIEKELNNGAFYYRLRDIVSSFDFIITPARDPDFYTFMRTVAKAIGKQPMAWRLVTVNNSDEEWITFARFADMPRGSHDFPLHSPIKASLLEVV